MNMLSFVENMVMTLLCSGIICVAKSIFNFIKKVETDSYIRPKFTPKKAVQKQFLISLFTFLFSLSCAWALPLEFSLLGIMKLLFMIISLYAFIFVWGAFDAALAFYPEKDPRNSEPPQSDPQNARENQINSQ